MSGKFEELTKFIPVLKEFGDGEWVFGKNKGNARQFPYVHYTETMHEFFHACAVFGENNPDLEEIKNYREIIKNAGIEWGVESMSAVDVSNLDAKLVLALLVGEIRMERFCDGAILGFLKYGAIVRCLERLKEIDEQAAQEE